MKFPDSKKIIKIIATRNGLDVSSSSTQKINKIYGVSDQILQCIESGDYKQMKEMRNELFDQLQEITLNDKGIRYRIDESGWLPDCDHRSLVQSLTNYLHNSGHLDDYDLGRFFDKQKMKIEEYLGETSKQVLYKGICPAIALLRQISCVDYRIRDEDSDYCSASLDSALSFAKGHRKHYRKELHRNIFIIDEQKLNDHISQLIASGKYFDLPSDGVRVDGETKYLHGSIIPISCIDYILY